MIKYYLYLFVDNLFTRNLWSWSTRYWFAMEGASWVSDGKCQGGNNNNGGRETTTVKGVKLWYDTKTSKNKWEDK